MGPPVASDEQMLGGVLFFETFYDVWHVWHKDDLFEGMELIDVNWGWLQLTAVAPMIICVSFSQELVCGTNGRKNFW